jgi:hypothetical protein
MINIITAKEIYIVASTLPLIYFKKYNKIFLKKNSFLILLRDRHVFKAYKNFFKKNIPIYTLSKNIIYMFFLFLFFKLLKKKIFFFHECCWVSLDIIIKILNIKSFFVPIVSMKSFKVAKDLKFNYFKNFFYYFLYKLKSYLFFYYYKDLIHKKSFFLTLKKYPQCVQKINFSYNFNKIYNNNAIFLLSKEICSDNEQFIIINKINNILIKNGIITYYKDHVNPSSRLNFQINNCIKIDPQISFESLNMDFGYIFGVASTPMAFYGKNAISYINLLKSYNCKEKNLRLLHLVNIYLGKKIIFLKSLRQIPSLIKTIQ